MAHANLLSRMPTAGQTTTGYGPLLTDVEKGAESPQPGATRSASAKSSRSFSGPLKAPWGTSAALVRWHWKAQHLDDLAWLFKRLLSGEVPGLVPALVRGDPDLLCRAPERPETPSRAPTVSPALLRSCRAHLRQTVEGCKDLFNSRERSQGFLQREIYLCRASSGVDEMGPEELYSAYAALVTEILAKPCLAMRVPVNYGKFSGLGRALTLGSWGQDSQGMWSDCLAANQSDHRDPNASSHSNPRKDFDLTEVRLCGVQLLHIAVERDSVLLANGQPAQYVERLLEAQADINAPAYYDTYASDPRQPGRCLQTAVHAIHLAVHHGSPELVDLLLRRRASPESRAVFDMTPDYTPLHLAAARGLREVCAKLLEAGGNAAETDLSGRGCHQVAALAGFPGILPLPDPCALISVDEEPEQARPEHELGRPFFRKSGTLLSEGGQSSRDSETAKEQMQDARILFTQIAQSLLHRDLAPLSTPRGHECQLIASGSEDPSGNQLESRMRDVLGGGGINALFENPLPEGRFYKKTKTLNRGCLLHFAVDLAMRFEEEGKGNPEAVVRMVLKAKANVHARAHYISWGCQHTCTALHMAAAAGSASVLELLLDAKASVEAMVTNDTKAHYTPLLDATFEGHYKVCKLLLERGADPNVPNRLGRISLHLAVLNGNGALARLLTDYGSDVTLEERLFQERPLLSTTRSRDELRKADMLCLFRSSQDSRCSILHDLSGLAMRRGRLAVDLLNYIVSPTTEGSEEEVRWLKQTKEDMIKRAQRAAAEGRPDEHGMTPVDHLATILENAPHAGIRLLGDVFMATPDVQDPTHGPLPVYANLRDNRSSWQPWKRWFAPAEPVLCDYKPDVQRRRADGREWPCWLFDQTKAVAEPEWHHHFAPLDSAVYESGDHQIVKMKVLLVANVLGPRFMSALASAWRDTEIFAEMPVRAIVGFVYTQLVHDVIQFMKALEFVLLVTMVAWAYADDGGDHTALAHRLCWSVTAAVSFQEVVVFVWTLCHHLAYRWRPSAFFNSFENLWGPICTMTLWALLFCTASGAHGLDSSHSALPNQHVLGALGIAQDTGATVNRALLGTNIILRSTKLVMLFRFSDVYGTGILAVVHSLRGVCTMFIVLASCFASFAAAFIVMNKGKLEGSELIVKVYRGLMLSDDDSLDAMEDVWGGNMGSGLMVMGTAIFTVYLLNILIAVLTAEYHKADAKANLLLWRERAHESAQVMLGPVWPWCSAERFSHPAAGQAKNSLWCCLGGCKGGAADDSECWRRLADLLMFVTVTATILLVVMPVHALFPAVSCSLALVLVRARLLRCEAWGAQKRGKRYYLWVCHRADYSRLKFIQEDVQKEHVDELREKIAGLESTLTDVHRLLRGGGSGSAGHPKDRAQTIV